MISKPTIAAVTTIVLVLTVSLILLPSESDADETFIYDSGTKTLTVTADSIDSSLGGYSNYEIVELDLSESKIKSIPNNFLSSYSYKTYLEYVDFPTTLESIGSNAFSGCSNLSVFLPSGLTTIGDYAFSNCGQLELYNLSRSLKECGTYAFSNCKSITNLTIQSGNINSYAFNGCSNLRTLNITGTANIKEINVFQNCSSVSTVVYSSTATAPAAFLSGSGFGSDVSVEVSGSKLVDIFGECTKVKSVELNGSFTEIPNGLFSKTHGITSLLIDSKITRYTSSNMAGLSSLTMMRISSGTIEANALSSCTSLNTLTLGSDVKLNSSSLASLTKVSRVNYGVETSVDSPFSADGFASESDECTVNVVAKSIVSNVFKNSSGITKVIIGGNVRSIEPGAFSGCKGLKTIEYNTTYISGFTSSPFTGLSSDDISFEFYSGTTKIPAHILDGVGEVASITLSESVIEIGDYAFAETKGKIDLYKLKGNGLVIGDRAFYEASGLEVLPSLNIKSIGLESFYGCSKLVSVILNDGIRTIGDDAFSQCYALQTVEYKCKNLTSGSNLFRDSTGLIMVDRAIKTISADLFCDYNGEVELHEGITSIGANGLRNTSISGGKLSSLPNLTSLGEYALAGTDITEIYIGPSLVDFDSTAFQGCRDVKTIIVDRPDLEILVDGDESKLSTLSSTGIRLIIPSEVTVIPDYAFKGVTGIMAADFSKIVSVGKHSFEGTSFTEIKLPETCTSLEDYAFAYIPTLLDIYIPNADMVFGEHVFVVNETNWDTQVYCMRHSTAADYNWVDDHRRDHPHYDHVEGEYAGMLEVIFILGSSVLGAEITNMLIDFFVDNISLNILESIDLGSIEANTWLLIGISIMLVIFLFLFIYTDHSEGVRIIEIILTLFAVLVIAECAVRRLIEYIDWYSILSVWVVLGTIPVLWGSIRSLRDPRVPRKAKDGEEQETLIRLYSLDRTAFIGAAFRPFSVFKLIESGFGKLIYLVTAMLLGWIHCALYAGIYLLCHIPAFIFSYILCKIFSKTEGSNRKHVKFCICPNCGSKTDKVAYKCSCGAIHKDLAPGKYGVHKAICGACHKKIKCGYKNRRWEDSSDICLNPGCSAHMNISEADPFSASLIGTSGSGKTTLIGGAMDYVFSGLGNSSKAKLASANDLAKSALQDFRSGSIQSTEGVPKGPAFAKMELKRNEFFGIYLYDISGEKFKETRSKELLQKQYPYEDGLIIMVNPYDLRKFALGKDMQADVSKDVNLLLDSFFISYDVMTDTSTDKKSDKLVAVVVSRASDAGLELSGMNNAVNDRISEQAREFLRNNGASNFINNLEFRFINVRYFTMDLNMSGSSDACFAPVKWMIDKTSKRKESML